MDPGKDFKTSGRASNKPKLAYIEISGEPAKSDWSPKVVLRKRSHLDAHMDNLKTILDNSNASVIKCRGSKGFACCCCDAQYPDPADLKEHTLIHDNVFESTYIKSLAIPTLLIKLDITDLQCKVCSKQILELDDLIKHLVDEHDVEYNTKINSHLVPFRFDSEVLRCVFCKQIFNNFKVLLEHMNVHYRNYVCEICDTGFVNRRISQMHGYRHQTGVYYCTYCGKEFNNRIKQKSHERAVHVLLNKRSRCGFCGERFTDYTKKNEHEIKEHGAKPVVLICYACEKTFENQRALTLHIKTFHLMER